MLANIKDTNPKNAPIFRNRLIRLNSGCSNFDLKIKTQAIETIINPKIMEMMNKMRFRMLVNAGRIKNKIANRENTPAR